MLLTLLVGLFVGVIAKLLMPGKDPGGWIVSILLGIAGAWVAHYIGVQAGWYMREEPVGIIASIIGALIILAVYRLIFTDRGTSRRIHH